MHFPVRVRALVAMSLLAISLTGCPPTPKPGPGTTLSQDLRPKILLLNFDDPVAPLPAQQPLALEAAKNETVSFAVQVSNLPRNVDGDPVSLHLQSLKIGSGKLPEDRIEPAQYTAYELLPMPIDLNRAGFIRHTGREPGSDHPLPKSLPRALLPVKVKDGRINLSGLRDPLHPRQPKGRAASAGNAAMLWFDVAIPIAATPGDYEGTFEVTQGRRVVSTFPLRLHVDDFVIPDDRHLLMVGRLEWSTLRRLYPAIFESARPELLTRKDPALSAPLKVIDQLIRLGQAHRTQVVLPQLQPQVKWPANAPPRVTWDDFDSVTLPWLKGDGFADKLPLGYWPLPASPYLANFDIASRAQYWGIVATHFDQLDLLPTTAVTIENPNLGRVSTADSYKLSAEAARVLASHPRVRVNVPLEEEQVQFADDSNPALIDTATLPRLVTAAPGLVFAAPNRNWPKEFSHPAHWLQTDLSGLVPYVGAGGDERDVRLWAWLAYLRRSQMIQWRTTLPTNENADLPADPSELTWFYPGEWFGVDEPLPTIQLKWLRRAEQDAEYLYLADQRGEKIRALVMARLITKPVEIPLTQVPDPSYALMCGTSDPAVWDSVKQLLAESILLRQPGEAADENKTIDLNGRTLQWAEPQERPLLLGRTTSWGWSINNTRGKWIDLRLGLDIYNAADQRLIGSLQWSTAPAAWQINSNPVVIPPNLAINTYNVRRFNMDASVNLDRLATESRQPIELLFTNQLTNRQSLLRVVAPVAISDRRGPPKINGDLDDWSQADRIHDGPLVRMFNRPAVQKLELQYASTPTQVYSGWSPEEFYLAFQVNGAQPSNGGVERSFVEYQFRRAWDEDLCQIVAQPVYGDGSTGPILQMTCKPRGQLLVERKRRAQDNANPWEAVVGSAVLYAATLDAKPGNTIWRAELAIPWDAMNDPKHQGVRPTLLRFNFSQHKNATGESASWAGPLDFGRDDGFTGVLYLRDPANPGIRVRD
jgi:hypothetical protein